jgi:hypothetical protein
LPETKSGQPLPKSGEPSLPSENTKPPVAGQPLSPQTQPKTPSASIMRATARCSSRSATVGIPNGRVPVLPGPLGISTRRTAGAR